jgi:hypothetical protein
MLQCPCRDTKHGTAKQRSNSEAQGNICLWMHTHHESADSPHYDNLSILRSNHERSLRIKQEDLKY